MVRFSLFKTREEPKFVYYIYMKIGNGPLEKSRIIAMSDSEKKVQRFVSFFFRGSHNFFVSTTDDAQKDPDIYTIIKVSKDGVYLPVWMLKYIQDEFDRMKNNLVASLGSLYTIFKNNGDQLGMKQVDDLLYHTFKSKNLENPEIKNKVFDDYVSMHWICVVPFDEHKMKTLSAIIDSIEYMTDTDAQYDWRIAQDYT